MHSLSEIQIIRDWTGERNARVIDWLLPIVYPDCYDSSKSSRTIDRSDFVFKIFKSSFDELYRHHYYDDLVYYYRLPAGSLLSKTFGGRSLRSQKWDDKKVFSEWQKRKLQILLTRDIGLSPRVAGILVNRPQSQYKRIEEFISGFVDSLWLADELVFLEGSSDRMIIKKVLRKIFSTGTFNLPLLVDHWKEYGNYMFHTLAETKLIGGKLSLSPNNFFKHLNGLGFISRVLQGSKTHKDMQNIAHLMSSRQMPYMGLKTELKARARFREVMESNYRPDSWLVFKMAKTAERIGRICRRISKGPINEGAMHFSVTSSGEFSHSIKDGAQAKAVMEGFKRHLSVVPTEDFIEKTPFGEVVHKRGIPLWKTAFRPDILETDVPFLTNYRLVEGQPDRVMGLDEYAGIQIMYAAWKDMDYCPQVRVEVVPEMGNKARHVTIAPYWLGVLQAPLAHVLIEAMKWHPSCFSSFHRQDQGWEFARQLERVNRPLGPDEYILSSDLKDATNAQQWDLTKAMLTGFMRGYGIDFIQPYVRLVIDTIGPRLIYTKDEETIVSNVGIMMGEPIAKPSLTLLNLCIEELAFLEYEGRLDLLDRLEPAPHRKWRCYVIGGDDHGARGPLAYLEKITKLHLACGSHIDPGKHGYSRICVQFTERILDITNLGRGCGAFDKNDCSKSIIVDTVKVRLLERGLSTALKKDNKNVAIGKSKQLGNVISWLPRDNRFYPIGKIESIRNLFIKRMGSLLPNGREHPRAFANIHLPVVLGGYGLGTREETAYWLALSPEPTRYLIAKKLSFMQLGYEQDLSPDLKIFSKLNHNTSVRGLESMTEYLEQRQLEESQEPFKRVPIGARLREVAFYGELSDPRFANRAYATWKDIKKSFGQPTDNYQKIVDKASAHGWLSQSEYINRCARGMVFQTLLQGKEELKPFNTVPWVRTYQRHVWSWYEREGGPMWDLTPVDRLDNNRLVTLISELRGMWYVNTKALNTVNILSTDGSIEPVEGPRLEVESKGLPSLKIDNVFLKVFKPKPEIFPRDDSPQNEELKTE